MEARTNLILQQNNNQTLWCCQTGGDQEEATLAALRCCLLSLRTRILILLADGILEALLQLFLSCRETFYTALFVDRNRIGTTRTGVLRS
jgi:hypothetical protein